MIFSYWVLLLSLSSYGLYQELLTHRHSALLFLFKLASHQFMVRSDTKRRTLAFRPEYVFNSPSSLENVPSSYVSECLAAIGPQLLQSIEYSTKLLNHRFDECEGQSLLSSSHRAGPLPPTHLLALFDSTSNNILLQPTHDIILSSQCPNAPELSPSTRFSLLEPTFCAVQLHLPHPTLFEPLHRYLYNQNATELLEFLLLLAKSQRRRCTNRSGDKLIKKRNFRSQMALLISKTYSVASLRSQSARVRHFQENMQALGVHSVEMWRLVTMASTVLRSASQLQKSRLTTARHAA